MSGDVNGSVRVFSRQVLQLVLEKDLKWPAAEHLRQPQNQQYVYNRCFNSSGRRALGPSRYRYGVLRNLIKKIEASILDPEEDEISDDLMDALSELMAENMPSEVDAARQRSWVTFEPDTENNDAIDERSISLLESRSVISGGGTTGLRTWEAALHLGNYLLSPDADTELVSQKCILELGAGTGFLSMLCAKSLGAQKFIATDGSEEVVEAMKTNIAVNKCEDVVVAGTLRWGWNLKDTTLASTLEDGVVDTVLGADVTYDQSVIPALVSTIRHVFEIWPAAKVIISATIRNEETFASFERACG
ncbi:hypothetical protein C1H76_4834 [Elsinoe australis]|uniref:Uncharacterized protein n=1 Tax=Elsinoe australis TaxID=40998 RepID=A0A4U7B1C5_9PEZI|nr:hypothetical protein C1H76_4834 [Elsinoe australis]